MTHVYCMMLDCSNPGAGSWRAANGLGGVPGLGNCGLPGIRMAGWESDIPKFIGIFSMGKSMNRHGHLPSV